MQSKGFGRGLWLGALAIALLVGLTVFTIEQADSARAEIPVIAKLPDFEFTERSGNPFGLQQMKGKISVVDFIFTTCPGACPVMTDKMSALYKQYRSTGKVQFVSITVDPDNDTLEALREYATQHGAVDKDWAFLRAPEEAVVKLSEEGFKLPAENLPAGHSTKLILVDQAGQVRGYYKPQDLGSMLMLKTHLRELALRANESK